MPRSFTSAAAITVLAGMLAAFLWRTTAMAILLDESGYVGLQLPFVLAIGAVFSLVCVGLRAFAERVPQTASRRQWLASAGFLTVSLLGPCVMIPRVMPNVGRTLLGVSVITHVLVISTATLVLFLLRRRA